MLRSIYAEVAGRDEPFEIPGDAEVGQRFVVDGVEHIVEEVVLWLDLDDRSRVVDGEARMRALQPTRAKTLEDGPCAVCTGA